MNVRYVLLIILIFFNYDVNTNKTVKEKKKQTYFKTLIDDEGISWLVDPSGLKFLSFGITSVNYVADHTYKNTHSPYNQNVMKKYKNISSWKIATKERIKKWNFNTLGGWTYRANTMFPGTPWTIVLNFEKLHKDWFSWDFENEADLYASAVCTPLKEERYLIGYFTGSTMFWGSFIDRFPHQFNEPETFLLYYLGLNELTEGHKVAVTFLQNRYGTIEQLNRFWNIKAVSFQTISKELPFKTRSYRRVKDYIDFMEEVAERYFKVVYNAIKRYDSNHLILGSRYSFWEMSDAVVRIEAKYTDVISYNAYLWWPDFDIAAVIKHLNKISGKPILISEFSVRSHNNTSDNPNTLGPGYPVHSQSKRADVAINSLTKAFEETSLIGYHWFQFMDQPPTGREKDGENGNTGLVDIHDNQYELLVEALAAFNSILYGVHSKSHSIAALTTKHSHEVSVEM